MTVWPPTLRSRILTLRAAKSAAAACFSEDWLAEAERAVLGAAPGCALAERIEAGDGVYELRVRIDGAPMTVGALAVRVEQRDLVWTWLAVAEAQRAFGFGGAAVPLIERQAAKSGSTFARVRVPATNGVALYFWLRLGYRPLASGSWPAPGGAQAGTWMVRELGSNR